MSEKVRLTCPGAVPTPACATATQVGAGLGWCPAAPAVDQNETFSSVYNRCISPASNQYLVARTSRDNWYLVN